MHTNHETPRGRPIPAALEELGGMSRPTLYRLLAQGKLQAVKVGSKTLITTESIDRFWQSLPAATFRAPRKQAA